MPKNYLKNWAVKIALNIDRQSDRHLRTTPLSMLVCIVRILCQVFFPEVFILPTLYSLEIMEFWCKQLFQMKNCYNSVLSFANSQQQYDIDKIDFIVT